MTIKIDLERAYDRLRWDFTEDTLRETRFLRPLIQMIMSYICEASL